MKNNNVRGYFPSVGDGTGLAQADSFYKEELQLALRNKGIPLEGIHYPITPTGMHYILIHYDIPILNENEWRLEVGGLVSKPLSLTLEQIKKRPAETIAVTMECAGNGRALFAPRRISQPWHFEAIGTAQWKGTSLRGILEEAGLRQGATEIVFTGLDKGVEGNQVQHYQRSLNVAEASRAEVLLAYEMNGEPLQPQHGYPIRLLVPGWYGMTSVKWLNQIEVVDKPFKGYQMVNAYRYAQSADDPGKPVNLIKVRALMIPPGIPDFLTRRRLVPASFLTLKGKAWAGRLSVARVEVSINDGATWEDARLGQPISPYAWLDWTFPWEAKTGNFSLCVRATDSEGNVQPLEQPWNYGGYGNNVIQRVNVIVE